MSVLSNRMVRDLNLAGLGEGTQQLDVIGNKENLPTKRLATEKTACFSRGIFAWLRSSKAFWLIPDNVYCMSGLFANSLFTHGFT